MVSTWTGFNVLSPDSWHPIPIMIADGDFVAVLLPTYGHFSGRGEHAPPPTGGRLDYGMVNMVRLEGGKLAEMWFGMDPLVEMQQLGVAPPPTPDELTPMADANLTAFRRTVGDDDTAFDNVAPFDDVVVAIGPSQARPDTTKRRVEIYRFDDGAPTRVYEHELITSTRNTLGNPAPTQPGHRGTRPPPLNRAPLGPAARSTCLPGPPRRSDQTTRSTTGPSSSDVHRRRRNRLERRPAPRRPLTLRPEHDADAQREPRSPSVAPMRPM